MLKRKIQYKKDRIPVGYSESLHIQKDSFKLSYFSVSRIRIEILMNFIRNKRLKKNA